MPPRGLASGPKSSRATTIWHILYAHLHESIHDQGLLVLQTGRRRITITSFDVSSLFTNVPLDETIQIVCPPLSTNTASLSPESST